MLAPRQVAYGPPCAPRGLASFPGETGHPSTPVGLTLKPENPGFGPHSGRACSGKTLAWPQNMAFPTCRLREAGPDQGNAGRAWGGTAVNVGIGGPPLTPAGTLKARVPFPSPPGPPWARGMAPGMFPQRRRTWTSERGVGTPNRCAGGGLRARQSTSQCQGPGRSGQGALSYRPLTSELGRLAVTPQASWDAAPHSWTRSPQPPLSHDFGKGVGSQEECPDLLTQNREQSGRGSQGRGSRLPGFRGGALAVDMDKHRAARVPEGGLPTGPGR